MDAEQWPEQQNRTQNSRQNCPEMDAESTAVQHRMQNRPAEDAEQGAELSIYGCRAAGRRAKHKKQYSDRNRKFVDFNLFEWLNSQLLELFEIV